jgi:hypothetical protein
MVANKPNSAERAVEHVKAQFQEAEQPQPAVASAGNSVDPPTAVSISSVPASADVEVDGKFVGNTPSSISLPSGDHTIRITKKGFKAWERKLTASGGSANVNAELEEEK